MSKGAQYLSYKSSNIQMRKPVFCNTFEWPPQPCIQKFAPCKFASHLVVGTVDITMELRLAAAGWLGGFGNPPPSPPSPPPPLAGWLAGAPLENTQNT